ncbi:aldose sugar dehydrogenase [Marinobacter vulgaris]|uniref:Aldose sugar dehydrogenase n=1 Tax=Marinobacter vulgaris TaxID=1928331 RepID=A0A2V3ZQN1_9GAMM|nr:PQQ-dependent sugar dehydrogenase [Marinobacter vulgaris]PXX93637.1 aldose sugar dehydrogenase [Marinobacter vulgaris]TSJ72346.1 PQQ-dependent sugar dehydrogenase [Marinobacter vulgaris]
MPNKLPGRALGAFAASALIAGLPVVANAETPDLEQSTVLSGLESPWDMAFLPDGTMFFTEKCKGLSVRLPDGSVNNLLGMRDSEGYATKADDLACEGQAGMNGVAVDPDFADNRMVYVYSASRMSSPPTNRVLRLTVNSDLSEASDRTDIVEDIPYKEAATDHPFGDAGAHNGGRIRFGPDGYLYVPTGDNHNSALPQSGTKLGGKVLRIDRDGEAAPGNAEATPEGFDPRIFTYGHRNVQGLAFHPESSQPIITEHGPWHTDEINALVPGANSGWDPRPNMAGRDDCPDDYCGYQPNQNEGMDPEKRAEYMPMTDTETYPDAMTPIWDNNGLSQGISSAAFLTGEKWGDWNGDLVVSFLGIGFGGTPVGQRINVIDLEKDATSVGDVVEMPVPEGSARFRALVVGPEGDLFTAVDEGQIYRLTPN